MTECAREQWIAYGCGRRMMALDPEARERHIAWLKQTHGEAAAEALLARWRNAIKRGAPGEPPTATG